MNRQITPVFKKIFSNQAQVRTLENLRDSLLPKLMSGEVSVIAGSAASAAPTTSGGGTKVPLPDCQN